MLISFRLRDPSELTSAYYDKTNFFSHFNHSLNPTLRPNSTMIIIFFLTQALGGSLGEPDSLLIRQLETLFSLFTFYHGSLERVRMVSSSLCRISLWLTYVNFEGRRVTYSHLVYLVPYPPPLATDNNKQSFSATEPVCFFLMYFLQ